ncbi:ammonium transporter [Rubritalea tangerina]|uniref:Ammonium transporter n=1 Tax=Rubritalea tangerina TaxID=430798 RepID=A0ABW4ZDY5_9BACT
MKTTNKTLLKYLLAAILSMFAFTTASAEGFDPKAEGSQVTAEMLDTEHEEYSDGAVDIIGKDVYKYIQFNGKDGLTENQIAAAEGYYDRYLDQPFFGLSTVWILLCAFLVFIMHLGFSCIESGMCQRKNTVNILFKNAFIICSGLLLYGIYGFNAMYPTDAGATTLIDGVLAFGKPISESINAGNDLSYGGTGLCQTGWADFIFQAMFAATAATIVSGAVAERIKLVPFMIFAVLLVGFAYPITGYWKWGGGMLDAKGFYDFAGSSVVHAFGGFAALACVLILGPRAGKFTKSGLKPILPSNLPLANIGALLLWFGWFGFNCGSVLSADPESISYVAITTAFGAAAGGLVAILVSWVITKKPDLSMALNGILAGLVGITAGADQFTLWGAAVSGGIGGGLVVVAVMFFDKIKIDDPVGAISVHGVVGIWGTLAVGLPFLCKADAGAPFGIQLLGTLSIGAFAFIFSFIVFYILKLIMGVRVDEQEEHEGLDVAEHGVPAYNDSAN